MSWTHPRIGVIGAGAIGGITAALTKQAGYDVEIVCKYENLARQINETGVHLHGFCGEHRVPMPAVAEIKDMKADKDLILLATKATDLVPAAQALMPLLTPDTLVVSLQNGICEETL